MAIFTGNSTAALFKNIHISAVENDVTDGLFAGHLQEQMAGLSNSGIGSEKQSDGEYSVIRTLIFPKNRIYNSPAI